MQQLYTTEYLLERLYSELDSKVQKKKFTLKKPQTTILNRKTYISACHIITMILHGLKKT